MVCSRRSNPKDTSTRAPSNEEVEAPHVELEPLRGLGSELGVGMHLREREAAKAKRRRCPKRESTLFIAW